MNIRRFLVSGAVSIAMLGGLGAFAPTTTLADTPTTATYFICPTTSLNNSNGMWVIGYHGGYYVLVPTNGSGSKDYLTVPVRVFDQAQIPAGWALYNSLPSYPNFVGTATILTEGIQQWLGVTLLGYFNEGDKVSVVSNVGGTYTVTVVASMMYPSDIGHSVTINHPIPLASGAVW